MFVVVCLGVLIFLLFFLHKKNTSYHTNCFAESILINNVLTESGQTTVLQTEWVKLETLEGAKIYSHRVENGHYSHGLIVFETPLDPNNLELENNTELILHYKEKTILPGGTTPLQKGPVQISPYRPFSVYSKSVKFPNCGKRVI